MYRLFLPMLMCIALLFAGVSHAVSDEFIVHTLVGDDTNPPTVPQNLTATPVATTQIDLLWDASTDDLQLSGYQVFRDGAQIATTTLTNYSDVGLTPSTTYTYYVTAFDSSGNISASSTEVSTTTLASSTPPTPTSTPESGGGGGERIELEAPPVMLTKLEIIPEEYAVTIRYETEGFVRSVIRWGRTTSYELGSLAERSFSRTHETKITGLTPDTLYRFTIEGENHVGIFGVLTTGSFMTLPVEDFNPPANVRDLRAYREGEDIVLSWKNPDDPDFTHVRILRNDRFYPSDTVDGFVVYEDTGESARDHGAAIEDTIQYYTVFSYDDNGNVSSGAIVAIRIDKDGATIVDIDEIIDETLDELGLTLTDFEFLQDERVLPQEENTVYIDGAKQLTIRISYELLPEHLKSILVTLVDPEDRDKVFSFLLRINREREYYTATLAPLGVSGVFPIRIAVFDFKTQQVGYADGSLVSTISFAAEPKKGFLAYLLERIFTLEVGMFLLFLLFLLSLLFIARRLLAHKEA